MRVHVALSPAEFADAPVSGRTVLAVDVLRATSAVVAACEAGCRRVVPVPDEAAAEALRDGAGVVLAGERGGLAIPGFDLGNSPFEYGFEAVAGRTLVFASTNGSRALLAARPARRRLLGAFVNAGAVLDALAGEEEVAILCSGKLGSFALEDAALAGWLVEGLAARGARAAGAPAVLARRTAPRDAGEVRAVVQGSAQGRYLRSLGPEYARDVEFCAGLDTVPQVFEV